MTTHFWNSHYAAHEYPNLVNQDSRRLMTVIRSLANEDGVYSLSDLVVEWPEVHQLDAWPTPLELILNSLIHRDGRYTPYDLRYHLRFAEPYDLADDDDLAEEEQEELGIEAPLDSSDPLNTPNMWRLPHHQVPEAPAASDAQAKPARRFQGAKIAVVSISDLRIYLPADMDIEDDAAVDAYVRDNLRRVREAAWECSDRDITVTDAYQVKPFGKELA